LLGKNLTAFEKRIIVEMDPAFKIEVLVPPQRAKSKNFKAMIMRLGGDVMISPYTNFGLKAFIFTNYGLNLLLYVYRYHDDP
jgi:hypothetical protein